jgi:hypothetical protein
MNFRHHSTNSISSVFQIHRIQIVSTVRIKHSFVNFAPLLTSYFRYIVSILSFCKQGSTMAAGIALIGLLSLLGEVSTVNVEWLG